MDRVVILVPSSSKNCHFRNVKECYLVKILYQSLRQYDISKYTFLIGFDDDDFFYKNYEEELRQFLPSNFHLHFIVNTERTYVNIVNKLAQLAIDQYKAEYLFVMADDLEFVCLDFISFFVNNLKDKRFGLGHAKDGTNNAGICTHPFIKAQHVKTLGYFYPYQIHNWYCDDWMTRLYERLNLVIRTSEYVLSNRIFTKRYRVYKIGEKELEELVLMAEEVLRKEIGHEQNHS